MSVSGEITEANTALKDKATLINSDFFTEGWIIKIRLLNSEELETIMNGHSYKSFISQDHKT